MTLNNIGALRAAIVYCIPRIMIMRDNALGDSGHFLIGDEVYDSCCNMLRELKSALDSAPPRNCDVGTAEEQYSRHDKYCNSQPTCKKCLREDAASVCTSCFAKWAQRPYEAAQEGDSDGNNS